MREEDFNELKKIVGKKVKGLRADTDSDDYGFDIVFEDGTVLELYGLDRGLAFYITNEKKEEEKSGELVPVKLTGDGEP